MPVLQWNRRRRIRWSKLPALPWQGVAVHPVIYEAQQGMQKTDQHPEPLPPETVRALLNPTEEHQSEAI